MFVESETVVEIKGEIKATRPTKITKHFPTRENNVAKATSFEIVKEIFLVMSLNLRFIWLTFDSKCNIKFNSKGHTNHISYSKSYKKIFL